MENRIIIAVCVIALIIFFLKKGKKKREDRFVTGYNEMVRAFKRGDVSEIKRLRKASELVEPELYNDYKAGLKQGYHDCTDPNVTTPGK